MRTSADHRGRQKTGEDLVARGTMGKPVTGFFIENGTDPKGMKLGKAKREAVVNADTYSAITSRF